MDVDFYSALDTPNSALQGGFMFFTADPKEVLEGRITDVYFERALTILKAKNINPVV
jgi:hypothetical protein